MFPDGLTGDLAARWVARYRERNQQYLNIFKIIFLAWLFICQRVRLRQIYNSIYRNQDCISIHMVKLGQDVFILFYRFPITLICLF